MASGGIKSEKTIRILTNAKQALDSRKYYEAHQLYRTIYSRYTRYGAYDELKTILWDTSYAFLNQNQTAEGSDLGILLVKTLTQSNEKNSTHWIPLLTIIFTQIGQEHPASRETFLDECIKWTKQINANSYLHQCVAKVYANERNYPEARYHFMHSEDGEGCARLLIEFQLVKGYKSEIDLFIAQAVLQYLCLKNKNAANETFNIYTANHPRLRATEPPYTLPLLNFLWLLLRSIEQFNCEKVTRITFAFLCEIYQKSLIRDPLYPEYLEKIGQLFFGVRPRPRMSVGIFGNILDNLFNEEENVEAPRQSTSRQNLDSLD